MFISDVNTFISPLEVFIINKEESHSEFVDISVQVNAKEQLDITKIKVPGLIVKGKSFIW